MFKRTIFVIYQYPRKYFNTEIESLVSSLIVIIILTIIIYLAFLVGFINVFVVSISCMLCMQDSAENQVFTERTPCLNITITITIAANKSFREY